MSFLKNMRVLTQISIISAIAVIGFIVVGSIYVYGQSKIDAVLLKAEQRQQGKDIVDKIAYNFLNARRTEKDFILRHNDKYAQKLSGILSTTAPQITQLKEFYPDQQAQARIALISEKLNAYSQQFNKVASDWHAFGLDEKSGLRGSLRKSVHEVESQLKKFDQPRLLVTMLMMRRHEKDFFLRIKDKYLGRMDKRLAEFTTQMAASNIPSAAKTEITTKMAAYHKDFKAAAAVRLAIPQDTKVLSKLFADVTPTFEQIRTSTIAELATTKNDVDRIEGSIKNILYAVMTIVTLLVGVLSIVIGRTLAKSVAEMSKAMDALASGDASAKVPSLDCHNEIGDMAQATSVFKENMIENERLSNERKIARDKRENRASELENLTNNFGDNITDALARMTNSAGQMKTTAQSMSSMAQQTAQQSNEMSNASEKATSNVQTVAAASEELSSSIQEISRQVVHSTSIAGTAVNEVEVTNEKIQGLAQAVTKIGEVVSMITDIADQTNLLALNATIEAARAGDAGKGFAVVASEVKNLANQTAKATEEISSQISSIQGATQDAVTAIGSIGGTISQLSEISSAIAAAVEEQGAATSEIARNVEQAATGTNEVSSNISDVTRAADQTGHSSEEVLNAANDMSTESMDLKKQVDIFMNDIKAL